MVKPVLELDFWRRRLNKAHAEGRPVHAAIYDCSADHWHRIQIESKVVLARHLKAGERILDAGCACGHLFDCLPPGVKYRGIDISPDFIDIARQRHPRVDFEVGDLADLREYRDKCFDWCVVRSVGDMVVENCGTTKWETILNELLRVGQRVLTFEYDNVLESDKVQSR